jgi:hypothetical protein
VKKRDTKGRSFHEIKIMMTANLFFKKKLNKIKSKNDKQKCF